MTNGIVIWQYDPVAATANAAGLVAAGAPAAAAVAYFVPAPIVIRANVRISESHMLQSQLAEHPLEDGSVVSEHVILKPRQLCLVYQQTNAGDGEATARQSWERLVSLWQSRKPFDVQTEHELYKNMMFERIGALHQAPFKGGLEFTADLRQINFVRFKLEAVPKTMLAPSVSKTGSTKVVRGYFIGRNPLPSAIPYEELRARGYPQNFDLSDPEQKAAYDEFMASPVGAETPAPADTPPNQLGLVAKPDGSKVIQWHQSSALNDLIYRRGQDSFSPG